MSLTQSISNKQHQNTKNHTSRHTRCPPPPTSTNGTQFVCKFHIVVCGSRRAAVYSATHREHATHIFVCLDNRDPPPHPPTTVFVVVSSAYMYLFREISQFLSQPPTEMISNSTNSPKKKPDNPSSHRISFVQF